MLLFWIRVAYLAVAVLFYLLGYWHESTGNAYTVLFFHNWPNAISVVICSALIGAVYARHRNTDVLGVTIGLIVYEMLQCWIPERTFDWLDIMGSIISMVLYLTAYHLMFKPVITRIAWSKCCKSTT